MPALLGLPEEEYLARLENGALAIGGSRIAAACGISPFMTMTDLWDRYMGVQTGSIPRRYSSRGHLLEPIIAEMYTEKTGRVVRNCRSKKHETWSYLRATPDRRISEPGDGDEQAGQGPGILEIKALGQETFERYQREGISIDYWSQLQHYLGIYGYSWGAFAVLNVEPWDLWTFDVDYDPEYTAELWEGAVHFWTAHIAPRVRPGEDEPGAFRDALLAVLDGAAHQRGQAYHNVTPSAQWRDLVERLVAARATRDAAKRDYERLSNEVGQRMTAQGWTRIVCNGHRVNYGPVAARRLDVSRIRRFHPEIADENETLSVSNRFNVYPRVQS
jgi:predicted phage-related endonuclease